MVGSLEELAYCSRCVTTAALKSPGKQAFWVEECHKANATVTSWRVRSQPGRDKSSSRCARAPLLAAIFATGVGRDLSHRAQVFRNFSTEWNFFALPFRFREIERVARYSFGSRPTTGADVSVFYRCRIFPGCIKHERPHLGPGVIHGAGTPAHTPMVECETKAMTKATGISTVAETRSPSLEVVPPAIVFVTALRRSWEPIRERIAHLAAMVVLFSTSFIKGTSDGTTQNLPDMRFDSQVLTSSGTGSPSRGAKTILEATAARWVVPESTFRCIVGVLSHIALAYSTHGDSSILFSTVSSQRE
jgi:hypothetical protein